MMVPNLFSGLYFTKAILKPLCLPVNHPREEKVSYVELHQFLNQLNSSISTSGGRSCFRDQSVGNETTVAILADLDVTHDFYLPNLPRIFSLLFRYVTIYLNNLANVVYYFYGGASLSQKVNGHHFGDRVFEYNLTHSQFLILFSLWCILIRYFLNKYISS